MFKYRLLSFPILMALLFFIFMEPKIGGMLFIALATLLVSLVTFECGRLFNRIGLWNSPTLAATMSGLTAFFALVFTAISRGKLPQLGIPVIYIFIVLIMLPQLAIWLMVLFKSGEFFKRFVGSFGIFASLGSSMTILSLLYFLQSDPQNCFTNFLFYVMLTAKGMDIGGYIFGMLSAKLLPGGNHKIAPTFSPKKSWEGFLGGWLLAVGISLIFYQFGPQTYSVWVYVAGGLGLGLASFFGDLTESGLKRSSGVKDSGNWIPGMGGVFDVVDSFIYVGPLAAIVYAISCLVY